MGFLDEIFGTNKSDQKKDDFEQSSDMFNYVLNSNRPALMYKEKAVDLVLQLKYSEALEIINKGLLFDDEENTPILLGLRASCNEGLKKFDLAVTDYLKAVESLKKTNASHHTIGRDYLSAAKCYLKLKDYPNAQLYNQKAFSEIHNVLYKKSFEYDCNELEVDILTAIDSNPEHIKIAKAKKEKAWNDFMDSDE